MYYDKPFDKNEYFRSSSLSSLLAAGGKNCRKFWKRAMALSSNLKSDVPDEWLGRFTDIRRENCCQPWRAQPNQLINLIRFIRNICLSFHDSNKMNENVLLWRCWCCSVHPRSKFSATVQLNTEKERTQILKRNVYFITDEHGLWRHAKWDLLKNWMRRKSFSACESFLWVPKSQNTKQMFEKENLIIFETFPFSSIQSFFSFIDDVPHKSIFGNFCE